MSVLDVRVSKRLPDFTLEVELRVRDEVLVLFGPSGAGKTMTLRLVAGLERPDEGREVVCAAAAGSAALCQAA